MYCQENPLLLSTNYLLNLILIMVILFNQPNNDSFSNMIERVQYNAALAITGAIKGTPQLKIYENP